MKHLLLMGDGEVPPVVPPKPCLQPCGKRVDEQREQELNDAAIAEALNDDYAAEEAADLARQIAEVRWRLACAHMHMHMAMHMHMHACVCTSPLHLSRYLPTPPYQIDRVQKEHQAEAEREREEAEASRKS